MSAREAELERSFVNNPWARALHPPRQGRTLVSWVALVAVSLVGAAIMALAFVMPLLFAWGMLKGGLHGHWGQLACGVIVVAVYAAVLATPVRRRLKARRAA